MFPKRRRKKEFSIKNKSVMFLPLFTYLIFYFKKYMCMHAAYMYLCSPYTSHFILYTYSNINKESVVHRRTWVIFF